MAPAQRIRLALLILVAGVGFGSFFWHSVDEKAPAASEVGALGAQQWNGSAAEAANALAQSGSPWQQPQAATLAPASTPAAPVVTPLTELDAPAGATSTPIAHLEAHTGELRTHQVVDGDTLTTLAKRYLGTPERFLEIYEANQDVLSHPDLLPIGVTLVLPAEESLAIRKEGTGGVPLVPIAPAPR